MAPLNRDERQTLRSIQTHLHESLLRQQSVTEQLGTVDVYFHPRNAAPDLNCVTPRRGVAWVRYEDLSDAFTGLRRLGRTPRFTCVDTLFPEAFMQQLGLMGLQIEIEEPLLVYRPLHGPGSRWRNTVGARCRIPVSDPVRAALADTPDDLAVWWSVFRQIYAPEEQSTPQPKEIESLVSASRSGHTTFITAWYDNEPLGVARIMHHAGAAKLDMVLDRSAVARHGVGGSADHRRNQ